MTYQEYLQHSQHYAGPTLRKGHLVYYLRQGHAVGIVIDFRCKNYDAPFQYLVKWTHEKQSFWYDASDLTPVEGINA